jgi:putative ABC transport system permease protein
MGSSVYIFTVLISLFAGNILGLIPAFQSLRCKVSDSLKAGGRGFLSSLPGNRTRTALVIVEGAVAFILVIGAGLMMKSFSKLLAASPGFSPSHLITIRIKLADDAQSSPYKDPWNRAAAFQKFLAGIEAVPGVQSAAVAEIVPLSQDDMDRGLFVIKEAAPLPVDEHLSADFRDVSPDYFRAMGIPLEQGRTFTEGDARDKPRVLMIDEALAREFFPGQSPIGKHLRVPDATRPDREIVGVVGSVRDTGLDQKPRPTIYFPYLQSPDQTMSVVVRSSLPPSAILPAIKNAVWAVDRDQPIFNVRTMDEVISGITSAHRIAFVAMNIFAVLALALAAIGIYGVTSYAVGQRTREIGIRMALGAQPNNVVRLVLARGIVPALWGIGIGVIAAVGLTRIMASLLYGVSAIDPLTFAGVAILLTLVALAACYIPARRAMRVDPMVALRHE